MSTLDLLGAAKKHPHYKNLTIFQIIHLRSFQALFVRHHVGTGSGSLYATLHYAMCCVGVRGARGVCGAVFRDTPFLVFVKIDVFNKYTDIYCSYYSH